MRIVSQPSFRDGALAPDPPAGRSLKRRAYLSKPSAGEGPESRCEHGARFWIPGSLAALAPRNDDLLSVMPGLVPGIHALRLCVGKDVDGRNKSGHDE
jgi:hypothetical protein